MHGTIFLYLQKFARKKGGPQVWPHLLKEAGLPWKAFAPTQEYPDAELVALVGAATRLLKAPAADVLNDFGQFLAPELLQLYSNLIHPEWKTLEVVANTEDLMHTAVRMRNPGAKPPMLDCMTLSENEIQIMYSSGRKLCSLAKGIITGMARHFDENIEIAEQACMLKGDPFCALLVARVESAEKTAIVSNKETSVENVAETQILQGTIAPVSPAFVDASFLLSDRSRFAFLEKPQGQDELGRVGHYRVLELLGQGSMGMVFRAEDSRLERTVALKVMQPHLASDEKSRQRFLREARAMAALKSDHIVTIYDVGLLKETPFLAMEFMEGESLETYQLREKHLPLPRVMRIGREVAEGLTRAHAKGFIHRDIKPSNLWVEAPYGRIKILDFGLAKIGAAITQQLSLIGSLIGTPAFMAPEQARGEVVDHRADLFSLGCVLYWLCTNELPFKGGSIISVLMALAAKEPQSPLEIKPDLPPPLSDLILQLLQKDPERRPISARIVADTLAGLEHRQAMLVRE